jgi:uracil phosphoribosyltransferase
MLATGGSAIKAMEVLVGKGVPEERILFVNLICWYGFSSYDSSVQRGLKP